MANWRDTYRPARFGPFNAWIAPMILLSLFPLFWPRWLSIGATIAMAVFLYYFEKRRNMDVASAIRLIRSWVAGPERPARSHPKQRMKIDYERRNRF